MKTASLISTVVFHIALWLSLTTTATLAMPPSTEQHYALEHFSTQNGLPHSTINSIYQSDDGYIWLATWEGPVRYNGREFQIFNRSTAPALRNASIRHVSQGQDGTLYFGGADGTLFIQQQQQWQAVETKGNMIFDILADTEGNIWLATASNGLILIKPDGQQQRLTTEHGLPSNLIYKIRQHHSGDIWLATAAGLVTLQTDTLTPEQPYPTLTQPVYDLLFTPDNGAYASSAQGIYHAASTDSTHHLTRVTTIPASVLLLDSQQQLWFSGQDRGLYQLTANGPRLLQLGEVLSNNLVLSLFQDHEHSIWVGTSNGLIRLSSVPFSNITARHGLQDNFARTVMEHSDGSLWIGSTAGIDLLSPDQNLTPIISQLSVLSLAEGADGGVWIGTRADGLLFWKDGKLQHHFDRNSGLTTNMVRAISVSKSGDVWVGSSDGVYRLTVSDMTLRRITAALPNQYILSLQELDPERLFVGTNYGAGIIYQDQFIPITPSANSHRVLGLYADTQSFTLWLATDRGLGRYKAGQLSHNWIGLDAGLASDTVLQVVADNHGYFWLTTNRGIIRLNQQQANDYLDNPENPLDIVFFDEKNGMQSAQANGGSNPAAIKRQNGAIVIATAGGVAMVQPAILNHFAMQPPLLQLESLIANNQYHSATTLLELPAGTSRVGFQLAGLSYLAPDRIKYRTKLSGFDKDWVERGKLTFSEYTNLPPGEYLFEATTAYAGSEWSPVVSQRFIITPYIWQRNIFWLLVAILLIAAMAVTIRYRALRAQKLEHWLRQQIDSKTQALQLQTEHLLLMDQERQQLLNNIKEQADFFAQQARQDALTGLANRRAFDEVITNEFIRLKRYPHPLCVALLDIDHFKKINDNWSHATGDDILKRVAGIIRQCCRETDMAARWGGEEFVMLLPETKLAEATTICERLRRIVQEADYTDISPDFVVTISIGLAQYQGETRYETLLARTDEALYRAKREGRNLVIHN